MKKFIKGSSILLYFLSIVAFFLIGVSYVGLTGAAKGQGLAGGAIVLGYGVIFAFLAWIASLFLVFYASPKIIGIANRILAALFVIFSLYFAYRFYVRQGEKEKENASINYSTKPVATTPAPVAENMQSASKTPMGLGFYTPNFYDNPVLYFYGNLNLEKSVQEHMPTDSMTFKQREVGGFDVASAPPWLVPDHLKLDYDLLYFRVQAMGHEFVEVTVNTTTQKTAYVSRYAGKIAFWPQFLLGINSVEFIDPRSERVRVKPLSHAGLVETPYDFMRPVLIKADWMSVELLNDDFKKVGKGWIQWQRNGELLINYSLLS